MNTSQCVEVLAESGVEQGWAVVVAITAVVLGTGLLVARGRPGRRGRLGFVAFAVVALGAGLTVGPFGYVANAAACSPQADPASTAAAAVAAAEPAVADVASAPESAAPDPAPVPVPDPAPVPEPAPAPEFVAASCPADNEITTLPAGHRISWEPLSGPDELPLSGIEGESAVVWAEATSGFAWEVLGTEGSASGPCSGTPVADGVCVPFPSPVIGDWWYWVGDPGEWVWSGNSNWSGCGGGGGNN